MLCKLPIPTEPPLSTAALRRYLAGALLAAMGAPAVFAQVQPADVIAGRWRSDAQFVLKEDLPAPSYFWIGQVDAEITPTGRLTLRAANGCVLTGLLLPVINNRARFKGAVNVALCKEHALNRTYVMEATYIAGTLKVVANTKNMQGGKVRGVFDITTTLARS